MAVQGVVSLHRHFCSAEVVRPAARRLARYRSVPLRPPRHACHLPRDQPSPMHASLSSAQKARHDPLRIACKPLTSSQT